MAEFREIKIVIENGEATSEVKVVEDDVVQVKPDTTQEATSSLGASVLVNQAFYLAKTTIQESVDLTTSRYFQMKEDYLGENTYNATMSFLGKVAGLGTSVVGGAVFGGPVGAVLGATGYAITEAISYFGKYSNYNQELNASNYQTGFMRARAGLTNGSKGTEN